MRASIQLSKYPQLNKLEQSVGVPQAKAYGAIGGFLLFTLVSNPGRPIAHPSSMLLSRSPPLRAARLLQHVSHALLLNCTLCSALLTYALLLSFAGFLTNLIGFFLPAYFSMKALESPQPQDDIQW